MKLDKNNELSKTISLEKCMESYRFGHIVICNDGEISEILWEGDE